MPKGKLHIQFSDLRGAALNAKVELDFTRMSGDLGVGGDGMEVSINMGSETDAIISNLSCRGGPGTMYRLSASAPHYRDYSFFQLIVEDTVNPASDDVEFWVKPETSRTSWRRTLQNCRPQSRTFLTVRK